MDRLLRSLLATFILVLLSSNVYAQGAGQVGPQPAGYGAPGMIPSQGVFPVPQPQANVPPTNPGATGPYPIVFTAPGQVPAQGFIPPAGPTLPTFPLPNANRRFYQPPSAYQNIPNQPWEFVLQSDWLVIATRIQHGVGTDTFNTTTRRYFTGNIRYQETIGYMPQAPNPLWALIGANGTISEEANRTSNDVIFVPFQRGFTNYSFFASKDNPQPDPLLEKYTFLFDDTRITFNGTSKTEENVIQDWSYESQGRLQQLRYSEYGGDQGRALRDESSARDSIRAIVAIASSIYNAQIAHGQQSSIFNIARINGYFAKKKTVSDEYLTNNASAPPVRLVESIELSDGYDLTRTIWTSGVIPLLSARVNYTYGSNYRQSDGPQLKQVEAITQYTTPQNFLTAPLTSYNLQLEEHYSGVPRPKKFIGTHNGASYNIGWSEQLIQMPPMPGGLPPVTRREWKISSTNIAAVPPETLNQAILKTLIGFPVPFQPLQRLAPADYTRGVSLVTGWIEKNP